MEIGWKAFRLEFFIGGFFHGISKKIIGYLNEFKGNCLFMEVVKFRDKKNSVFFDKTSIF